MSKHDTFMLLASKLAGGFETQVEYVQLLDDLRHTDNLFGPPSDIAGKKLRLVERNFAGDCLCLFRDETREFLVDADHRDIAEEV